MTRTDNDTWDIATSVGATAVMVALARATETNSDDPLIRDEFAGPLVSTPELAGVRDQVASMYAQATQEPDEFAMRQQEMVDYQAVRTHFFDEFFAAAAAAGIRQVVILAAGLDSRAYRLAWPHGTTVYEVDLPKVLEYKSATLAAHGATPSTTRREVAVDLRQDWPKALHDAGFDATAPTAWLAEGLLPFLPGPAQDAMFIAIDGLSAPGSRVAVEVFGVQDGRRHEVEERLAAARAQRGQHASFNPLDLWYGNEGRPDCAGWFGSRGWTTRSVDSRDESARLGRQLRIPDDEQGFFHTFVTAESPV
jgi:methyltransferase (TIGR00027 family)